MKNTDIDILNIVKNVATVLLVIALVYGSFWAYNNVYKPKEKKLIWGTKYVYQRVSEVAFEIYKKQGFVYKEREEYSDPVCQELVKKYSKRGGDCTIQKGVLPRVNFKFDGTDIEISGFEKPPHELEGGLVKEILFDVNGASKGANTFGEDVMALRIYSVGRLGGLLSPVNCNHQDSESFGIPYAEICPNGLEVDYLAQTIPFRYEIFQVGSKDGKLKKINRNVSYLRADCSAFGGETVDEEYCDTRGYAWLNACNDEYVCSMELGK